LYTCIYPMEKITNNKKPIATVTTATSAPIKPMVRLGKFSIPKWIFFSLITVFLYGLMGIVAKFASNDIPPLMVQVISTIGMIPLVILLFLSGNLKSVHGKARLGVIFATLVGVITAISAVSQFTAFNLGGPASIVVPVISLASLVTVLLARFVFKDRLNFFQLIGVVLSIIAIILFNLEENGISSQTTGPWWKTFLSTWMLFALLALFAAGTAQFFIKAATNHVSADLVTFIVVSIFIIIAVVLIFTQSFSWDISLRNVLACLAVGVLGSAAFFTQSVAYSSGVASLVAPLCSLFPVVTVILAVPLLGEKLTVLIIIAVVIASLAGIALSMEKTFNKS